MRFRGVILFSLSSLALLLGVASALPKSEQGSHWSFQPVKKPPVPAGARAIDAFVLAKLREQGLSQNPSATPRDLARRAYFDLIGLPPTPEEIAAFEQDHSVDRFDKLVDRLLASSHYGERWGRHWLDLVRFAQSNGYERDGEKLLAWRYRDYVINAFNQDKPYDRFIIEQIAGDELPDGTADSLVATAFQRLAVFDDEPDDKRMAEFDALDDILSTTATTFLGLTVGCARCHDHKTDPLPQAEYYSMLAFFRGVRPFETGAPNFDSPGFTPLASPEEISRWRAAKTSQINVLKEQLASASHEAKKKEIEADIKKAKETAPYEWTLAVRENGRECPATHVLSRGNAATPKQEVQPGFPKCLTDQTPQFPNAPADAPSTGRRSVLAEWIASAANPLTARVIVNRIWQHHFGQALVPTPSDFGRAGLPPSHPELLDLLASEFMEGGWSIKKLHKLIMTSATYRQSSHSDNERALALDPGNRLLWRQNLRRLEAEAIRDSILAISGSLNPKAGGRGFFPHLAGEVLAGQSRPGLDWDVSPPSEQSRRSVYAFVRRTMGVPLFEAFDYSNTTSPLTERPTTTVAPQALMLLNDAFMHEQAAAFAARIVREAGSDPLTQARRAYALAFNRAPSDFEAQTALRFLDRNERNFGALISRSTFKLDVPNALSTEYFQKLAPAQFLAGPSADWTYYRGVWAPPYEGIRVVDRDQTPFALWNGAKFEEGSIEADILLSKSCEFASVLFCARAESDAARGYELVLHPKSNQVLLRKCGEKMETLAQADFQFPNDGTIHLKIGIEDARVLVWFGKDSQKLCDVQDAGPIRESGQIGVRAWGGSLTLENLRVSPKGRGPEIAKGQNPDSSQRALESFCLLLLNLNELLYID